VIHLLCFAALGALAEPGSPSAEEVAQHVRQLGADDYHVREEATRWLWAAGPAAEDALKAGLKSDDAEVVARCRDLLDKIPYGITPDMPRRFVELIATARSGGAGGWPAVAPELLDLGPRGLAVARQLIDRLATNDGQRTAMNRTLDLEGWRVAPGLIAAGETDKAGELLERSAGVAATLPRDPVAVRHYAAFLAVRGKLDDQLPRWRELAAGNVGPASRAGSGAARLAAPTKAAALVILTYLARLHGDLAEARTAAEQSGRADLKEAVLFDQGAWADLAELPITAGMPDGSMITAGLKAMYLTAAGKSAEAKAALDDLKALPVGGASPVAPPRLFRALMYAGHPADALAALDKEKRIDGVLPEFEVLCQQRRYAEAFAKLDRPVGDQPAIRWQWATARLRVYHERGEREQFDKLLAALAGRETLSPPEATAALVTIEDLVTIDRTAAALPIAAAVLASGTAPGDVFVKLYPKASLAAETWWRFERLQHPDEPMRATVQRLPALLDRRIAEPAGRAELDAAAKLARTLPDADADRWLQGLAQACQSAGLDEQARTYCREAAERTNSAAAWLRLGDLHAEAKQFAEAAAAYEKAWRADTRQPLPLWLRGWALEKAGQPGGREARDLARMLPLGNDDARVKFAEELNKRAALGPELRPASWEEERLVLGLSGPGTNNARNAQRLIRGDRRAKTDRLWAADAELRFLMRLLRTNTYFYRNQSYLAVLHGLATHRAVGLLQKGDVAGAIREAEAAQALLPGADEPAATLVPELTKRGKSAEADRVYSSAAAVQDRLCKDWPQSAVFHNNRGWLSARCRRDLDAAADHARKAVELEPTRANYRETLAEVLFQRGDQPGALAEIKRCIELEPKESYFAKQQARIESGDRDAALPER
jgi:tetratricopeptide (TPR) repeat protein